MNLAICLSSTMKLYITIALALLVSSTFFVRLAKSGPERTGTSSSTARKLLETLQKFGEENQVSMDELLGMIAQFNLKQLEVAKGSIGIIRTNVYVSTSGRTNGILLDGKWFERARKGEETTVVVVSKGKIVSDVSMTKADADDLLFLVYRAETIEFFDWNTGDGGSYQRAR